MHDTESVVFATPLHLDDGVVPPGPLVVRHHPVLLPVGHPVEHPVGQDTAVGSHLTLKSTSSFGSKL